MFAKKSVAAILSVALAFGAIPSAAIAEAASEVQSQRAGIEFRINATADDSPWTSFASAKEALEAAKKADEERAARASEATSEVENSGEEGPDSESANEPESQPEDVDQGEGQDGTIDEVQDDAQPVDEPAPEEDAPADNDVASNDVAPKTDEEANQEQVEGDGETLVDPQEVGDIEVASAPAPEEGKELSEPAPEVEPEPEADPEPQADPEPDPAPESEPAPAVAPASEPAPALEISTLEVRLANVEGKVELRTRATDATWPKNWPAAKKDGQQEKGAKASEPFADLQMRLGDDLAKTHDVWYRLHVDGAWLDWVSNGESAAPKNTTAHADDLQVLLLTKEESKLFVATKYGTEEAPSDVEGAAAPADSKGVTPTAQTDQKTDQKTTQKTEPSVPTADDKDQIRAEATTPALSVTYRAHAQDRGWMSYVSDGAEAGTTGSGKRLEAINISLPAGTDGGISYKVHSQDYGWMGEVSNGAQAGTTGSGKRLEAIKIWLTGNVATKYDVWYRVHCQDYGWLKWTNNGCQGGTVGLGKRLEAIQIILVPKGGFVNATIKGKDKSVKASVTYCASVVGLGWLGWMGNAETAGTTGISAVMNGFSAKLVGLDDADLHYNAHVQNVGWQGEVTGGTTVGIPGSTNRVEAITMRLSGKAKDNYDIYYRCHVSDYGWMAWAKNNEMAGSGGFSKRVEAVQVTLVPKGGSAPTNDSSYSSAYISMPTLTYRGHVQDYGWLGWVHNGETAGTSGQGKRVESLEATIDSEHSGSIEIMPHVQNVGWMDWVPEGECAGTVGMGRRVEAICVRLTGDLSKYYDVWYRVHAQNVGWMGWTKNGEKAGTEKMSLRLEAIQIEITAKGGASPGSTATPYIDGANVTKMGYQNPSGYYQVSSRNVRITSAARAPWNYVTPSRIGVWSSRSTCVEAFVGRAYEYLGSPYMWNYSCAPSVGVDCIGLVYQCAYACGMDLGGGTGYDDFNPWAHYSTGNSGWHSHDANNFWDYGRALHVSLGSRQRGDLISYPGHIAVYVGNDTVVEAVYGAGVVERNMYASGSPRGVIRMFQ